LVRYGSRFHATSDVPSWWIFNLMSKSLRPARFVVKVDPRLEVSTLAVVGLMVSPSGVMKPSSDVPAFSSATVGAARLAGVAVRNDTFTRPSKMTTAMLNSPW
jgi:hypothetical protein